MGNKFSKKCPICNEEITNYNYIQKMKCCNNFICKRCLYQWFIKNYSCPFCPDINASEFAKKFTYKYAIEYIFVSW
jgi:hypothetical protein